MSNRKISEKYNDSCIKIFALISLFSKGTADFSEVIKLFADDDGTISQKSNVILNKYMNTLEIFGIKIRKTKNKYYLLSMPFTISLNEEELYAVSLIKSAISILPDGKNKTNAIKFLAELEKKYDNDTKNLSKVVNSTRNFDLSFYFQKFKSQIKDCESLCEAGKKIELCYNDTECGIQNIICIPQEVKYRENLVSFCVYNTLSRQVIDIPVDSIRYIHQLNIDAGKSKICTTVIFKLKGDLIKRYNLRDWERSEGIDGNGWMTIVNSGEDLNTLTTRLFKYDENCVVVTPKYLKTRIKKLIDKTLKNYE